MNKQISREKYPAIPVFEKVTGIKGLIGIKAEPASKLQFSLIICSEIRYSKLLQFYFAKENAVSHGN